MGACTSRTNSRPRSHKYSRRSRKHHGKPPCPLPEFSMSKFVQVESAGKTRRKTDISNMKFHLTQLQWHHTQVDVHGTTISTLLSSYIYQLICFGFDRVSLLFLLSVHNCNFNSHLSAFCATIFFS